LKENILASIFSFWKLRPTIDGVFLLASYWNRGEGRDDEFERK